MGARLVADGGGAHHLNVLRRRVVHVLHVDTARVGSAPALKVAVGLAHGRQEGVEPVEDCAHFVRLVVWRRVRGARARRACAHARACVAYWRDATPWVRDEEHGAQAVEYSSTVPYVDNSRANIADVAFCCCVGQTPQFPPYTNRATTVPKKQQAHQVAAPPVDC